MRETSKQINREYIVMIRAKETNKAGDMEATVTDALRIFCRLVLWGKLCLPSQKIYEDLIPNTCEYDIWKLGLCRGNQGKIKSLDLALLD